tara:strand:- start:99 stop:365 length:267 start_codon:yes stop_codon:yes gene_type:complete
MSKKPKKKKREKTLCEELNWGQGPEFFGLRPKPSDDEVDQYRATTTGQKPPPDPEIAELDAEPQFQNLKDAGITADDMVRFIRLMQGL